MIRVLIEIGGVVQGVGFRPFVHKRVRSLGLCGYIRNTPSGVEMELEGGEDAVARFCESVAKDAPKLARVEYVRVKKLASLARYGGFEIRDSGAQGAVTALIPPDVAVCADCLREMADPRDRRYRYPFINCTNCGPRFTIIRDIPYDRGQTTMAGFTMCTDCAREFGDIEDRRYHAQPVCCPNCGPRLFFLSADGTEVPGDAIEHARGLLMGGGILAVKGLGGVHLACLAENEEAASRLRARKKRDEKPFAVMCRDIGQARRLCRVSEDEARFLTDEKRSIVLLKKREALMHVSENAYLGVVLPYTPVHVRLMEPDMPPLVMTSANLSDMPILSDNAEAIEKLASIADGYLLNDRDIRVKCDDSLLWVVEGEPYFVRRSRGYVPYPVTLEACARTQALALGAEQKASFALAKGRYVFPSQHIGDLKNIETYENYKRQIAHFERLFDIAPKVIACDLHPDYLSTRYAEERAARQGLLLVRVQHHFAHMVSCMADNALSGEAIGVIFDGAGYGADKTVWGGEILTGGAAGYVRAASLYPFRLPGGDAASREIWRVGAALMDACGLDAEAFFGEDAVRIEKLLNAGLNCPVCTSAGRLFDGVSALMDIKRTVSYEGQGAVLLEAAADSDTDGRYPAALCEADGLLRMDWRETVRGVARDCAQNAPRGEIAAKFMNTLVGLTALACEAVRERTRLSRVVLSGGVFQNLYVLERLGAELSKSGFSVYHHHRVSTNDEGLSLGQLAVALEGGVAGVPGGSD